MHRQARQVLSLLKERPITQREAIKRIGCFRLASRISELRDAGFIIETDKFGFGHLATYTLLENPRFNFDFTDIKLSDCKYYTGGIVVDGDQRVIKFY